MLYMGQWGEHSGGVLFFSSTIRQENEKELFSSKEREYELEEKDFKRQIYFQMR